VDRELESNVFVERAFWVAAALAAVGGVGPLLVGIGHTNRIGAVLFPFAAATVAMAAVALFYRHGRSLSALVYFLGGLAIAYGLLLGLSVPMRLAVTGACPPAPQICSNGYELQLTGPETTGLTIAVAFGIMSLFAGFVGLATLYRQRPAAAALPPVWPAGPPESPAPPPPEPEPQPEPEPEPVPEPEPEPAPAPIEEPLVDSQAEAPPPPPPPPSEPVADAQPDAKPKRKRRPKPPTA
jgi:hypothetical protein